MKRGAKALSLLLILVFILCGCSKVELKTTINSGKSATVTSVLNIKKSVYDKFVTEKLGYNNPEAYFKSKVDEFEYYYEVASIDGEEYYRVIDTSIVSTIKKNFMNEVNSYLGVSEDGLYISKDTIYGMVDKERTLDGTTYMIGYSPSEMKTMGYPLEESLELTLSFQFPSNVVTTNGTIDSNNPKLVTFNINLKDEQTLIYATTTSSTVKDMKKAYKDCFKTDKPKINSIKVKNVNKKKAKVSLTFEKYDEDYIEVQYCTNKKFEKIKHDQAWGKKTSCKLTRGKTYYMRARTVKFGYDYKDYYSKWTKPKKIVIE